MKKKKLQERREALLKEQTEHLARLTDLAGEDLAQDDARNVEISQIDEELAAITRLEERTRANATRSGRPLIEVHDNAGDRPFESLGDQLRSIALAQSPGGSIDPRLMQNLAASGASATVPSDGGFLIRSEFTTALLARARETSVLAQRCTMIPIGEGADSLEAPFIDETSRANGSRWGGVRVYRTEETTAPTATKPKLGKFECRLEDLKGLAYASDRLLQDASALEAIYSLAFAEEFAFVLDDEILNGDGVGKCLGILNAPALVTQAAEGGQTADTVRTENIAKMRSRLHSRSRAKAVWLINQDIEPSLHTMFLLVGSGGGSATYLPANGLSASPYDTLYGRPVIPCEQCATLGDVGDIILVDLSQYILIAKGGVVGAQSMHVRFVNDEMTFKWKYRVNGQPKWKSSLTPFKGTATQSPYVALAAR